MTAISRNLNLILIFENLLVDEMQFLANINLTRLNQMKHLILTKPRLRIRRRELPNQTNKNVGTITYPHFIHLALTVLLVYELISLYLPFSNERDHTYEVPLDLLIILDHSLEKRLLTRNELFLVFLNHFRNYLGRVQNLKRALS